MVIRMRIDGQLHRIMTIPQELKESVVSRLKIMAKLDIVEKRIPQDGRAVLPMKGTELDMRTSTLPTIHGEKVVIRILRRNEETLNRRGIGIPASSGTSNVAATAAFWAFYTAAQSAPAPPPPRDGQWRSSVPAPRPGTSRKALLSPPSAGTDGKKHHRGSDSWPLVPSKAPPNPGTGLFRGGSVLEAPAANCLPFAPGHADKYIPMYFPPFKTQRFPASIVTGCVRDPTYPYYVRSVIKSAASVPQPNQYAPRDGLPRRSDPWQRCPHRWDGAGQSA